MEKKSAAVPLAAQKTQVLVHHKTACSARARALHKNDGTQVFFDGAHASSVQ
jgi:hypothetical protein